MQNISYQDFKTSCSKLAVELKEIGVKIPHTKLLNMVARSLGYKDYNTFKGIQDIKEKNGYRIYVDEKDYQNCIFKIKHTFEQLLSEKFNQVFIQRQNCNFIEVDFSKINSYDVELLQKKVLTFFKECNFIKRIEHIVFQDVSKKLLSFDNESDKTQVNRFPFFVFELKKSYLKAYIKYIDGNNLYIKTDYNEDYQYRNNFLPDEHFIVSALKSDVTIKNAKIENVFLDGKNSYLNTSQGKVYFDLTSIVLKSFNVKELAHYTGKQNILFCSPPGRGRTTLIESVVLPNLKNKKIAVVKYYYNSNNIEYYDNIRNLSFLTFDEFLERKKEFDILYLSEPSIDYAFTNEQKDNLIMILKNEKNINVILDVQDITEDLRMLFKYQVMDYEMLERMNDRIPKQNIIKMIELKN